MKLLSLNTEILGFDTSSEFAKELNVEFELLGIEMPRFLGNTPNGVRLTKLTRAFRPRWIPIV